MSSFNTIVSKKGEDEAEECAVCCEPYNKSNRLLVECEHVECKYKACLECVRSYLLSSANEPHCMDCKLNWPAKFLLILKKNWLNEVYRPHREKLLCDIELSKVAEAMPDAERYMAGKKQDTVTQALQNKLTLARIEIDKLNREIQESHRISIALKSSQPQKEEEKKVFFMPCPAINCKGMLSTQYKCGICELFTCPDCHEVIGEKKTNEHTCDPNNIASATAIKKETKQCPGCHNRIYRVEGCSQMWCTGCHTAFDWNTGRKVVSERLHNPHWIEYQRNLHNGTAPKAPGDVPCGGLCTRYDIQQLIKTKLRYTKTCPKPLDDYNKEQLALLLQGIHSVVEEITYNRVRDLRTNVQSLRDFKNKRIQYIVGEITKEELSEHIFRSDKTRQKQTELLNVYELLSAVGIDFFNKILMDTATDELFIANTREQVSLYNNLRIYCNGLFAVISNTYNMTAPQIINDNNDMNDINNRNKWAIRSEKFNGKTLKKKMSENEIVVE